MQGRRNGIYLDNDLIHVVYAVLAATRGDKTLHHRRPTMGATTPADGEGTSHPWEGG